MQFTTYGNKENPSILLLHPMFTNRDFFSDKAALLVGHYFLIVPTLSGHYTGSIYQSMQDELESIDCYLRENEIGKIDCLIGFSLGGNIAYHYFCTHTDTVGKVVIDSAPLFTFPRFVKQYFYNRYKGCLETIKKENTDVAGELNKCFNGMGDSIH